MLRSMTGFGGSRRTTPHGVIEIEIRSVNNRYLDASFRGLRDLSSWEPRARAIIQQRVNRGKIDVFLSWERSRELRPRLTINLGLLDQLIADLQPMAERWGLTPAQTLGPIPAIPGAVESMPPEIDLDAILAECDTTLVDALERLDESRLKEGAALGRDLNQRLSRLRQLRQAIESQRSVVVDKYRQRLSDLAQHLSESAQSEINQGRLESEIALYADRCDITEELVRLSAHLDDFESKLRDSDAEAVGKPLEFLVQELLREVNTIGSKGRDTDVSRGVLEMKNEIEKIREQAQNIE